VSEFVQEQQPEPRVLPPRMTERVQALTELRRDETTTEEPRVPTAFVERLQQFMRQENIGVRALAIRLGKNHGTVSVWLTGKNVCSTQAEVLHELGLGPPPPPAAAGRVRRRHRSTAAATRVRRAVRALQPKPLGQLSPPLVVAIKKERV
jgi:hypothetical protein